MEKTKVVSLLQSLNDSEWRELEDFVASPFYNKHPELLTLFSILRTWLANDQIALKSREDLFKILWPDQVYNAKALTYALSNLNKLASLFLSLQKITHTPLALELAALEVYSERNLEKHYAAAKRSISDQLTVPTGSSFDFFRNKARFAETLDQHHLRQKNRVFDVAIQSAAHDLDTYYYLRRLNLACSMLDRQQILKSVYETNITEPWIIHLKTSSVGQAPIIRLYLDIYQMLSEESEEAHFIHLKNNLEIYSDQISHHDLTEIYQFAINYCARKIRKGREPYVKEALNLYLKGIESRFLIVDGQLSPWTYANVIKLYLRQKEYDAAQQFIEKFLPFLPEAFQQNAYHYNLAELFYYTKEQEKAQSHLVKVAYTDLNYYLGARVLLAKIYFETGEEDALASLLAAFMMFLQRNKALSHDLKQTYLNFCKILARIIRTAPARRAAIRQTISNTQLLTDRDWLLSIIKLVEDTRAASQP
ncbi:tetratricopeptide repeat protein [Lewinella sp. LCG006]|uniref:tetratricopeptide repeat protein n=1 Tax=Lewinella sp. LCG006 TaxID=3231911 RepID=UPI003460FD59